MPGGASPPCTRRRAIFRLKGLIVPKQIRINGFAIYAPVHLSPGLWRHPQSRARAFNTLGYWQDVARLMERGLFDALFIADSPGVFDIYGGGPDAALRSAI